MWNGICLYVFDFSTVKCVYTDQIFILLIFMGFEIERYKMASQTPVKHFILWVQHQENQIKSVRMKQKSEQSQTPFNIPT